jgi:glycosyltransferase involved in cell wall biosynthesis
MRDGLERVAREVQPEVIHAQFGPAGVLIGPVAERIGVPLIVSFHGYDVSILAQKEFWVRRYEELFGQVDAIHAVSAHIAKRIEKLGGDPVSIRVIHNGIDIGKFRDLGIDGEEESSKGIRCLHVGRLVEKKSPLHLIRAFREARDLIDNPDVLELAIAGDGPLRSDAEEEAVRLGISDAVCFKGQVSHHVVPGLMRSSDIYAMHCMTASNGDQEGMGVAFAEASAMGLPIVATQHNGIPEVVVDGETGYLVPEGDVGQMGEKIAKLAKNKELRRRFGKNGRKHIEENFDLEKQTEKFRDLYAELVKRG